MKHHLPHLNFIFLSLSLFFLSFNDNSFAATININVATNDTIAACRENHFTATYIAPGNHRISILAFLTLSVGSTNTFCDNGINLHPNVYIIVDSIKNASATNPITDTTDHNCIWRDSLLAAVNDTVRIYYRLAVDCAALTLSGSNLILNQKFTGNGMGVDTFRVNNSIPPTDTLFNTVQRPYLSNTSPTNFYANYLDTVNLTFTFKNTGFADANIAFRFYPDTVGCNLNTVSLWYADSIGGVFDTLTKGVLTNAVIKKSNTLVIKQRALVDKCLGGCGNNAARLIWQCNSFPSGTGIFCQQCQGLFEPLYSIKDIDTPKVSIVRIAPAYSTAQWDNSCVNDTANMLHWSYMITNTDKGALDTLNILLTSRSKNQNLSIVPRSSFTVDTSRCEGCLVSVRMDTITGQQYCAGFIPVPLDTAHITVRKFGPTDTLYVNFQTFRCIETNELQLMNNRKYYNQWELQVTGISICKKTLLAPSGGSLFFPSYGGSSGIGSSFINDAPPSGEFDMNLIYTPSVSHLAVSPGQQFGDIALLNIDLNNISKKPTLAYTQLLGCQGSNCTWNGYLKVKIYCDTGLVMMHPDSDVYFSIFDTASGSAMYIFPQYYNDSVPGNTCTAGNYYFYFSLHDTIMMKMLKDGFFNFKLQACCGGGAQGEATYNVSFYLMPDPGNCFTLTFTDPNHIQPPNCAGLGCEWLPMSSVQGACEILCPGCKAPGLIADSYEMTRETFGLQDSDNDGKADVSMMPITPGTTWFNTHQAFLGLHNSAFGEKLTDRLAARLQPGDPTNGGYDYLQMQAAGGYLNYLQLLRTIPGGTDTVKLQVTSFTLYIDTPTTVNPNCINCTPFNIDSTRFRTMRILSVSGAALSQYLQAQGGNYLFTFSSVHNYVTNIDSGTLHSNISFNDSISPFRTFFETQRYRLQAHYDQCGLYDPVYGTTEDPATYRRQANINNRMWLSGHRQTLSGLPSIGEMPNDTGELHLNGWSFNPADSLSMADSAFAGHYLFICEAFGCFHYFYTSILENATFITKDSSCIRQIETTGQVRTAGGAFDIYPFEYNPPKIGAAVFKIDVPPGYYIDSSWAKTSLGAALETTNYVYFRLADTTGTVYIPDSILPPMNCINESVTFPLAINDTSSFSGDKRVTRTLKIRCRPFSCSDTTYIYRDTTVIVSFDAISPSCLSSYTSCGLDTIMFRLTPVISGGKGLGVFANLKADAIAPVKAKTQQVCFPVTLTNESVQAGSYSTTEVFHIFIVVPDAAQAPEFTGWEYKSGGNTYYPNINGVINVKKSLPPGNNIAGELCAVYKPCAGTGTITFYYGWNCNGYPFSKDSTVICGLDSFTRVFIDETVNFQPQGKFPPPYFHLCDTFDVVIPYISSAPGGVQPDSVLLSNLPANLTLVNVFIEKCYPPAPVPLSPAANPLTWRITGHDMDSIGYPDSLLSSGDCMDVKIRLLADCGYAGEQIYAVTLFSHNYCGDTIINITNCSNPYDTHGSYCTDCFTVTKTALADTVILNDTMSFKIKICGNNSSAQYVTINELLPDTVTSNFVLTGTIPPFLLIPAQGCDSFLVTGYFTTPGPATDTNHINKVEITTANSIVFESSDSVTVMSSCYDPSYIVIQDSTFASSLAGKNYANDTLLINNRFYIDVDTFTLTHCLVYTEPGAQIIVLPGSLLILDSTDVIACTSMWRGILMKNDSKVLIKNRSRLHDAENGVFIDGNSRLDVLNSYILDCVTGIYVDPNSGLSGSNVFIKGSSFGLNAAAFKDKYQGQPSHGAWPKTGIEINNVSVITIGDNSFAPNRFFKSSVGILARQSGLTVKNSLFESIYADTAYHRPFEGTALVGYGSKSDAIASHLTVSPQVATTPMVQNSYRGIYTNYSSLWVNSVKFVNLYAGVYSIRCSDLLKSQVSNCYMEVKRFGIYWIHNQGSGGMIADNDTIKVRFGYSDPALHLNSGAIMLIEKNIDAQVNYSVFDNTIEIDSAKRGIWANGVHRPDITHNKISVSGTCTGGMEGVSINGCDRAAITCNIINGLYPADTSRVRGINTNECQHSAIVCNHTDSTYRGVFFGGFNPGTKFRGNEMNTHFEGLFLNKAAVIDTQAHAGNKWWGPFTAYGGVNMNNTFGGLKASEFFIDPGLNPEYFFSFPFPQNLGWVFADSGNTFDCNWVISPFCNPISTELRAELIERMIAEDSLSTVDFNDESQVKAMIYLYERLMNDSVLLATDEIFRAFLEEHSEGPIGYLYEAEQEIRAASAYDSIFTGLINHAYNLRQLYSDSLENIDYYIQHSIPYTSEEYMLNQIAFLEQTISNLILQRNGFTEGYFNSAELVNDLVIPEGIPDANETLINEVEIQFEENGDDGEYALTTYYNDILGIAQQCPYSGGKAVYKARAYVAMVNDTIEYDDETACLLVGIYKNSDKTISKANRVQIVPNPANETVKVILNNPGAKICDIKIYNIIDEKVFSRKFDCKEKEYSIDIRSLVPGTFTVKINMDNAEPQMKKLVIVR